MASRIQQQGQTQPTQQAPRSRPEAAGGPSSAQESSLRPLILAPIFGLAFGFLLQKGGVAKYHVLVGQLLLEDFTVAKVMLTAIVVGAVGVFALHRLGWIEMKVPVTRYGANILGGLIFGVGFGLIAYCPGTDAAAVGQGNFDALVGILGLMAGSYLFAVASDFLDRTVNTWGERGKLTLPELIGIPPGWFLVGFTLVLALILVVLETTTTR